MRGVAIDTADVVAPVLAAAEVVVLFPARVTPKTGLGSLLRRLTFKRNDLLRIAFFDVRLAWTMTRLTTGYLLIPTADLRELCV